MYRIGAARGSVNRITRRCIHPCALIEKEGTDHPCDPSLLPATHQSHWPCASTAKRNVSRSCRTQGPQRSVNAEQILLDLARALEDFAFRCDGRGCNKFRFLVEFLNSLRPNHAHAHLDGSN